jgi:hypothetical protein
LWKSASSWDGEIGVIKQLWWQGIQRQRQRQHQGGDLYSEAQDIGPSAEMGTGTTMLSRSSTVVLN